MDPGVKADGKKGYAEFNTPLEEMSSVVFSGIFGDHFDPMREIRGYILKKVNVTFFPSFKPYNLRPFKECYC